MSENEVKPETAPVEIASSRIIDVTSVQQLEEAAKAAKGRIIVDMVQADCGGCEDEKPLVEQLAARCVDTTVLRIDVEKAPELADKLDDMSGHDGGWGGTPTMLLAETGDALLKGDVEEVEPGKRLLKRLKCARVK